MNRPGSHHSRSSAAPTRVRTVWRRLYRLSERLDACHECAVAVFIVALSLLIVLGVFR